MTGGRNRDVSVRKALRKKRISERIYHCFKSDEPFQYYDNLHQFSKNKIHCSCPMCSPKTRNKGRRGRKNYHKSVDYKHSDRKRVESMEDEARFPEVVDEPADE